MLLFPKRFAYQSAAPPPSRAADSYSKSPSPRPRRGRGQCFFLIALERGIVDYFTTMFSTSESQPQ